MYDTFSLRMIGSWGGVVGWLFGSRFVGRGRVIGWLMMFRVLGNTLVFHISDKSVISVDGVVHSLSAAIGKENMVVSLGVIAITMFFSTKVNRSITIVILDSISIVVVRMGIFILGFMVRWGRFVRAVR